MKDGIRYAGYFTIEVRDEFGNLKDTRKGKNLITNDGLDWLIQHTYNSGGAVGGGASAVSYISIGSTASGGTAVVGDSATVPNKVDKTAITYGSGATNGYASGTATFAGAVADAKTGITEAALWAKGSNNTGSGVLFARQLFASIDKTGNDTLSVTWDIQFS